MAVMAIVLSAAMPVWSQMIRRDKEEELIFRGTQYARAINQYQRKFASASPAEPRRADRAAHASKEIQRSDVSEQRRRVSTVVSAKSGNDGHSGQGPGQAGPGSGPKRARRRWHAVALQSAARSGPRRAAAAPSSASPARTPASPSRPTKARTTTTSGSSSEWRYPRRVVPGGLPGQRGGASAGRAGRARRRGRQGGGREGGTTITTRDGTFTADPPGGPSRGSPSREGR